MEVWKDMDGKSNPPTRRGVVSPPPSVESSGEIGGVIPRKKVHPQMCGNLPFFPQGFPRVVHTFRASSSLKAWTFLLKVGSLMTVSSTFRME